MADSDKTLIGDANLSNNRNPDVPNTYPTSSGNVHPDTYVTHHGGEPTTLKRKQTSFQITSVTVQGSRLSTDGGDDSADDLDESHTEDASSDILDCSRTTDVDNDQLSEDNSNPTNNDDVPIPAPSMSAKCKTEVPVITDTPPSLDPSENPVPETPKKPSASETLVDPPTLPDQWQHRFRVVKIVSSEPFKRGRWLCMDFMDPPAPAVEAKPEVETSSSTQSKPPSLPDAPSDRVAHIYEISPSDAYASSISVAVGPDQIQQPMYGIFLPVNSNQYPFVTGMNPGAVPIQQEMKRQEVPQTINTTTQGIKQAYIVDQKQPGLPPAPGIQICPQHQSQSVNISASVSVPQQQPASAQSTPPGTAVTQSHGTDSLHVVQPQIQPSSSNVLQAAPQSTLISSTSQMSDLSQIPVAQTSSVGTQASATPNIPEGSLASSLTNQETVNVPSQVTQNHVETKELGTPPSSQTSQEVAPESAPVKSDINGEDSESAGSGTSTVAIDNKIEQAMDLVKSHLMFAVREEVDVLKEKITELMDRISQLEYENGFLRANASQQTLEQLNQSQLLQQQQQNQPSAITINSFPQITPQQQINIQNQPSTS